MKQIKSVQKIQLKPKEKKSLKQQVKLHKKVQVTPQAVEVWKSSTEAEGLKCLCVSVCAVTSLFDVFLSNCIMAKL